MVGAVAVCLALAVSCGCEDTEPKLLIKSDPTFRYETQHDSRPEPTPSQAPVLPPRVSDTERQGTVIAVDPSLAPYTMVDADGELQGYDVDVVSTILERMGLRYSFTVASWPHVMADVKVGRAQLALSMSISQERQRVYRFTNPYNSYEFVIFAHRDTTNIGGETSDELLRSLEGKSIGLLSQSIEGRTLRAARDIHLIEMPSVLQCFERLAAKEVEACSASRQTGLYYVRDRQFPVVQVGAPFDVQPYATAVTPKFDGNFVAQYNAVLAQMRVDGTLAKLNDKWFGSGG